MGTSRRQGAYLIESYVAERLRDMLAREQVQGQQGLFVPPAADLTRLDGILDTYDHAHAIELTQAQRDAVCTSEGTSLMLVTIFAHRHRQQEGTSAFLRY